MKWTDNECTRGGHTYKIKKSCMIIAGKPTPAHSLAIIKDGEITVQYVNRSISRLKDLALEHYLRENPTIKDSTARYVGMMHAIASFDK